MDDFVVNVRQIGQYPPKSPVAPTDLVLLQEGNGTGLGAYKSAKVADLVSTALQLGGSFNLAPGASIAWNGAALTWNAGQFSFSEPLRVPQLSVASTVTAAEMLIGAEPVATLTQLESAIANVVSSVNGRHGAVMLELPDILRAGGLPAWNPHMAGVCTAPSLWDVRQSDDSIATTNWVHRAICFRLEELLELQVVTTFDGRFGAVTLMTADVNAAFAVPGAPVPQSVTPPPGDNSLAIATTAFVAAAYAPINSPNFTGIPTVPTPSDTSDTNQIANTAWVQQVISGLVIGGGGATAAGPQFSVQFNNPALSFAGDNQMSWFPNATAGGPGLLMLDPARARVTPPTSAAFAPGFLEFGHSALGNYAQIDAWTYEPGSLATLAAPDARAGGPRPTPLASSVYTGSSVLVLNEAFIGDLSIPYWDNNGLRAELAYSHTGTVTAYTSGIDVHATILPTSTGPISYLFGVSGSVENHGLVNSLSGVQGTVNNYSSSTVGDIRGGSFGAYSKSGPVTKMTAIQAGVQADAGAIGNLYGLVVLPFWCATAVTVANYTGAYISRPEPPGGPLGAITDCWGVYIEDFSGKGTATSYNIRSAGASSINFLEGSLVENGSAAMGNVAKLGTAVLSYGDPVNAYPVAQSFPLLIQDYQAGDLSTLGLERSDLIVFGSSKHTGTSRAFFTGVDSRPSINSDSTGPWFSVAGMFSNMNNYGSGNILSFYGLSAQAFDSSPATINKMFAVYANLVSIGAASITNAAALYGLCDMAGGGAANLATVWAARPTNHVGVQNGYGVYIEDHSGVGSTLSYNILSKGAASINFLEGSLVENGSAAIGNVAKLNTLVESYGDPVHATPYIGQSFPLLIQEYQVGDLSTLTTARGDLRVLGSSKHTGTAQAYGYSVFVDTFVNSDSTGPWNVLGPAFLRATNFGSGHIASLYGVNVEASDASLAAAIDNIAGVYTVVTSSGGAAINTAIGVRSEVSIASGTCSNLFTVYASAPAPHVGITNTFGLFVADHSGIGSGLNCNFYSQGPNARNIIEGTVEINAVAVASLPAAGIVGRRKTVTDASATLTAGIGAVVAGGGTHVVPVFDDGAAWRIG